MPITSAASTSSSPCPSRLAGPNRTGSIVSERAGDDLVGAAVPAERVYCDADLQGATERAS